MSYNTRLISVSISMNKLFPLSISILLLLPVACTRSDGDFKLPGVYRISVMQGNVIEQDMIDRLKPGMEKHQVKFIMGSPTIIDPFHPDRWDYIYTFTKGASQRTQRHLAIYFEDGKLAYLDGDVVTGIRKPPEDLRKSKIVEVPLRQRRQPGLVESVLDKLPFVGKDEAPPPPLNADNNTGDSGQQVQKATEPAANSEQKAAVEPTGDNEQKATEENAEDSKDKPEEKGFFGRILDKLPFVGDDKSEATATDSQK